MGREIRKVPASWEHPKDEDGNYRPLYDRVFATAASEWKTGFAEWERGLRPKYCSTPDLEYWEYEGRPPEREAYRPQWSDAERTHFQFYETVSEGTPLSPPMPTIEALARWLADNHRPWGSESRNLSYEEWLKFLGKGGSAPSLIVSGGGRVIEGGVEFMARKETAK